MKEAKERYEKQANEHRSEAPRYHEGDLVWLSSVHIKTQRPSPKLSDTWLGPYKVLKAYSQTCVLELDDNSPPQQNVPHFPAQTLSNGDSRTRRNQQRALQKK